MLARRLLDIESGPGLIPDDDLLRRTEPSLTPCGSSCRPDLMARLSKKDSSAAYTPESAINEKTYRLSNPR